MPNKNLFFFLLFLSMIAWGASWVNVKIICHYIDVYEMIFMRYFISAVAMVPIIIMLKQSFKIDFKSFLLVLLSSLVLIAYMNSYYLGTKYGTASLGGAMVTTLIPINTFIILALMRTKKVTRKDTFALGLGAVGVLTMLNVWSLDSKEIFLIQNLYFFLGSILWAVLTIISSKSTKISPIVFTFYMYVVMIVLVWTFAIDSSIIISHEYDSKFWINMLCMSLLSTTFANTIYFLGIEKLGAREVSSFTFLVPFAAIVLSAIFLDEKISIAMVAGTILTIVAVKMLNDIKILKRKVR
jgi:drug/metabolite transporter (DMT)-like permease